MIMNSSASWETILNISLKRDSIVKKNHMVTGNDLGHIKVPEYLRAGRNIIRTSLNIFFTPGVETWLLELCYMYDSNKYVCRSRKLSCNKEPREYFSVTSTLRARDLISQTRGPLYVLDHACESFMVTRSRGFHSWCNVTVLEYLISGMEICISSTELTPRDLIP